LGTEPDSYGWRVRDARGNAQSSYQSAAASYRSSFGRVEGAVAQSRNSTTGTFEVDGAVATLGGGVYASNRIDDAFAVVKAGAPGVDVLQENRVVGTTNSSGNLLVPNLRAYQRNRIAIDPKKLPTDAEPQSTQDVVAPADRSGIVVNFGVKVGVPSAIVVLKDKAGAFIQAGSRATLDGASEPVVVGYDGRTYMTGLGPRNRITIATLAGECHAEFPYTPQKGVQQTIGPYVCQ
jgi:outer membrane usher protein